MSPRCGDEGREFLDKGERVEDDPCGSIAEGLSEEVNDLAILVHSKAVLGDGGPSGIAKESFESISISEGDACISVE